MADKIILEVEVNGGDSGAKSLKTLKQEFKETQKELDGLNRGSKEYIATLSKLGGIKDDIGDLNAEINAFNPEGKVQALSGVISGVASGFQAATGLAALFGQESENVQKALLKVQATMALVEGLKGIAAMKDQFIVFGNVAKNALAGVRAGIAATGIGLFVVALGTIVAYWDSLKSLVSGVSTEQLKLNELAQLNVQAEKDKLDLLNSQDNVLKLQGKSEEDILRLKIRQTDEVINSTKAAIVQKGIITQAQLDAEKRNHDILGGLITFTTKPLELILKTIDYIGSKLGKDFGLSDALQKKLTEPYQLAISEIKKEGEKSVEEDYKLINQLINQRAGYQLQVNNINAKAEEEKKKIKLNDKKTLDDSLKDTVSITEAKTFSIKKYYEDLKTLKDKQDEEERQADVENLEWVEQTAQKELEINAKLEQDKAALKQQVEDASFNAAKGLSDALFAIKLSNVQKGSSAERELRKKQFNADKAFSLVRAGMDGIRSVTGALAQTATLGPGAIALAVANGLLSVTNVAKIAAMKFDEGGGSSVGSIGSISAPSGISNNVPTISQNANTPLTKLNSDGSINTPVIKAIVTETDISTTQKNVNSIYEKALIK